MISYIGSYSCSQIFHEKPHHTSLDEENAFLLTIMANLASWLGELFIGFGCHLENQLMKDEMERRRESIKRCEFWIHRLTEYLFIHLLDT